MLYKAVMKIRFPILSFLRFYYLGTVKFQTEAAVTNRLSLFTFLEMIKTFRCRQKAMCKRLGAIIGTTVEPGN